MSDSNSEYGLIKSFDIDNGELDGLRPNECFVLGYELAQIDSALETGVELNQPIHAENRARISKSCEDANRQHKISWMAGDSSESWMWLQVAPAEQSGGQRNS